MRPLRPLILLLVTGLLVAGCGLGADPVVRTQDEVVAALLALGDGAEGRVTAAATYDEDEVRAVLRDDAEARALLEAEFGDSDVDGLLEDLAAANARLGEHAVLVGTGADGSGRIAASWRDQVWLDVRAGGERDPSDDGGRVDLQARVDWATVAALVDEPDLVSELDDLGAAVAPFLGTLPQTDAVQRVLLGLLGGELVAISGPVTPSLLAGLQALLGAAGDGLDLDGVPTPDIDRGELLATALTFDGFRTDGDDTLVDVHLELRAAAELVLDRVEAADGDGPTADAVRDARAALDELPERLEDVAVVRLGPDGVVRQVRTDVLDVGIRLAPATDDPDVAVAARVLGRLDATGLFVTLDVTAVGTTPTVLGDAAATATPAEVAAAISGVLFRGLGAGIGPGLDGDALRDLLGGIGDR